MGGFDILGGSVCCFTPGDYVDIYQGSVSSNNTLGQSDGPADSTGTVHFTFGQNGGDSAGLHLVHAYPTGTIYFIAVSEGTGAQHTSIPVQVVTKLVLTSGTWFSGDTLELTGFPDGSSQQVCLNASGHSSGCDKSLGNAPIASSPNGTTPDGTGTFTMPSEPSGSYLVVVGGYSVSISYP